MSYLLGYDLGSSSIKATLLDVDSGEAVASATSPKKEMDIIANKPGWAEQDPNIWWEHIKNATHDISSKVKFDPSDIKAIGISYQMHGLVCVDEACEVLRPAIIWCDSRGVEIGDKAATGIGADRCLETLMNLPGNFTASKLRWIKENEPDIYSRINKIMLPGDFIAMKLSGNINTTASGLSECIVWDYKKSEAADFVLDYFEIEKNVLPELVKTFSVQGELSAGAAEELGLKEGTVVSYRAGDQPNNALSLNVLNPGEVAVTAGTSGVVYGVSDKIECDKKSRVNVVIHVNHLESDPRYGALMCVSAGSLNSWLKHHLCGPDGCSPDYELMNELAEKIPVGSEGLTILPYGNGAERTLENLDPGASVHGLNFNIHTEAHFFRAAQEGVICALKYGLEIMNGMGIEVSTVRAGHANMFLSPLFAEAFATVSGAVVELYDTDGSQGAARGAGIGAGIYKDEKEAFDGLKVIKRIEPNENLKESYMALYANWRKVLEKEINI